MSDPEEVESQLVVHGRPLDIINESGLPTPMIVRAGQLGSNPYIPEGAPVREIANTLSRWVDNARAASGRTSMFDRGAYTPPENPYDEMRVARRAVKYDSVVSGVAEVSEAYAFQGVKWESPNRDEADIFNQLAIDQNLDAVIRAMWKEEFTCSQYVAAKIWGEREYTVRGATNAGNKRKKTYKVWVPLKLVVLDTCRVVPIGVGPLGGNRLAWQSTIDEIGYYQNVLQNPEVDPLMYMLYDGIYEPGYLESSYLASLGVDTSQLVALNPAYVFRHTLTKADYQPFPDIRLKSVFQLLDLKNQLMASDRAMLIGAANYILLVRKGSKEQPAKAEELQNVKENFNLIAKLPVIVSDHRLEIDIISPKTDATLHDTKYSTLNRQILGRLMGVLESESAAAGRNDTQQTLSLSLARVMDNRRHMIRRTLEREIARAIVNHPRNAGMFDTEPNLVFTPRDIALSMDTSFVNALITIRASRDMSRETFLEFFGLDEENEAMRLGMEAERYDHIFGTIVPYSGVQPTEAPDSVPNVDPPAGGGSAPATDNAPQAPAKKAAAKPAKKAAAKKAVPEPPGVSGRRGGRPQGGGTSSSATDRVQRTPPGQPRPKPRKA